MTALTIRDIAKLAGVGVSTVSRALNNYPDVNKKTKQKILDLVKEYNYLPNENAKNLKQTVTNNVVIIVKGKANPFFEVVLEQMQSDLESRGYNALVTYIDERSDEIIEAARQNNEKKPEGIIFLGGTANRFDAELVDFQIPCVVSTVYVPFPKGSAKACVCVDDKAAASLAVEYLIAQGHKNIVVLGGELGNSDAIERRYTGARETMSMHGLVFDERNYIVSKFSMEEAYDAMKSLMAKEVPVTAIFAMADVMAIGAAKAVTDAGLNVPGDISVIGFDGIDICDYYNPTLATIRQPAKEIASKSVDMLIHEIDGTAVDSNVIFLETKLIKGNSVKQLL